ncbi:hypothetical protein CYY_003964 [Polysphondylium violaceum]|uniref:HORMA domain-containing protein n=1 Tax=Polysphondylium violaceum TaxID=133409 RepID=A0A8J4V5L9_9MYCE|nr:hypothetical protein CYY_003964 [Polysphondylium violaceum]
MFNNSNNHEFFDIVLEFIETAFHTILYIKGVYPSCLFTRALKYDIPVPISRASSLSVYIANSLNSLKPLIVNGTVDRIELAIFDNNDTHADNINENRPIEKFIFSFQNNNNNNNNTETTIQPPEHNYYHMRNRVTNQQQPKLNLNELENSFKSFLLKLISNSEDSITNLSKKKKTTNHSSTVQQQQSQIPASDSSVDIYYVEKKDIEIKNVENDQQERDLRFEIIVNSGKGANSDLNPNLAQLLDIDPLKNNNNQNNNQNVYHNFKPTWINYSKQNNDAGDNLLNIIPLNIKISDGINCLNTFIEK